MSLVCYPYDRNRDDLKVSTFLFPQSIESNPFVLALSNLQHPRQPATATTINDWCRLQQPYYPSALPASSSAILGYLKVLFAVFNSEKQHTEAPLNSLSAVAPCPVVQPFVPASGKSAPVVQERDSSAWIPVGHAQQQPARVGQQNKAGDKRDFERNTLRPRDNSSRVSLQCNSENSSCSPSCSLVLVRYLCFPVCKTEVSKHDNSRILAVLSSADVGAEIDTPVKGLSIFWI